MKPVLKIDIGHIYIDQENTVPFWHGIGKSEEGYLLYDADECPCCAQLVSIKNARDYVLIMPVFSQLTECAFDSYKQGILLLTKAQYKELCALLPNMPNQEKLDPFTKSDAAYIALWSGPCNKEFSITEVLAPDFSLKPKLSQELYLATTAPEGKGILAILENMLQEYAASEDPVALVPSESDISIVLDTPDYFEWKPLSTTPEGYALRLEPGFQVKIP